MPGFPSAFARNLGQWHGVYEMKDASSHQHDELLRIQAQTGFELSAERAEVTLFVNSSSFATLVGLAMVAQLFVSIRETDLLALGHPIPTWLGVLQWALLTLYAIELGLRIFAYRRVFFHSRGNVCEFGVVAFDISCRLLTGLLDNSSPPLAALRIMRLSKVVRSGRLLTNFQELHAILLSLWSAMKAIFWSIIVLIICLTIASMIAVEVIHPLNVKLAESGAYDECERCPRAFASVMQSNLTLFQGIVAGDSWGLVIIPIVEANPGTAVFFITLTVIVSLGLMNLVLTSIVERANHAVHNVKKEECQRAKNRLMRLCKAMDKDGDGVLTLDEIKGGMTTPGMFSNALKTLEVKPDDVNLVFNLMDTKGAGYVSYAVFLDNLHRMKTRDTDMMLMFIQHHISDCHAKLARLLDEEIAIVKNEMTLIKSFAKLAARAENDFQHNESLSSAIKWMDEYSGSPPQCSPPADTSFEQVQGIESTVLQDAASHGMLTASLHSKCQSETQKPPCGEELSGFVHELAEEIKSLIMVRLQSPEFKTAISAEVTSNVLV